MSKRFGFKMDCRCFFRHNRKRCWASPRRARGGVGNGRTSCISRLVSGVLCAGDHADYAPVRRLWQRISAAMAPRVSVVTNLPNRGLSEEERIAYLMPHRRKGAGRATAFCGSAQSTREGNELSPCARLHFSNQYARTLPRGETAQGGRVPARQHAAVSRPGRRGAETAVRRTVYILQDIFPGQYGRHGQIHRMASRRAPLAADGTARSTGKTTAFVDALGGYEAYADRARHRTAQDRGDPELGGYGEHPANPAGGQPAL